MEKKKDDSKDIVTIDYYDRINSKWIKVEVTKEVAKFLKTDEQSWRRKQNKYNYYCMSYDDAKEKTGDESFFDIKNDSFDNNENSYIDNLLKDIEKNYQKILIENSLYSLTTKQREIIELRFYKKHSWGDVAKILKITKQSALERYSAAVNNIKKYIENNEKLKKY